MWRKHSPEVLEGVRPRTRVGMAFPMEGNRGIVSIPAMRTEAATERRTGTGPVIRVRLAVLADEGVEGFLPVPLRHFTGAAVPELVSRLKDGDPEVRGAAARRIAIGVIDIGAQETGGTG